jgi:hypothetical protein
LVIGIGAARIGLREPHSGCSTRQDSGDIEQTSGVPASYKPRTFGLIAAARTQDWRFVVSPRYSVDPAAGDEPALFSTARAPTVCRRNLLTTRRLLTGGTRPAPVEEWRDTV